MEGSSDARGASYGFREPPKLALFRGVLFPGKLQQAFALFFVGSVFFVVVLSTETFENVCASAFPWNNHCRVRVLGLLSNTNTEVESPMLQQSQHMKFVH